MKRVFNYIKAQAGKVKQNSTEVLLYACISLGLPAIAYLYIDWKAAFSVAVLAQIVMLILKLREGN